MTVRGAAAAVPPVDDELATVARLRAHEQELSRRLDEARRAAAARVFDAREAAARAEALAEADCRQEITRLRHERASQLGAVLDGIRDETAQQMATVGHRAAVNQETVVARLLAVVTGQRRAPTARTVRGGVRSGTP